MRTKSRRMDLLSRATVGAAVLAVVCPAASSATDYCVGAPAGCSGTNLGGDLALALDKADDAKDADRIFLGPKLFMAATPSGFRYLRQDGPVEIIGAGPGATVIEAPVGSSSRVLEVHAGPGSAIRNLRIHLRANTQPLTTGLFTGATVSGVTVSEDPLQSSNLRFGVVLGGGRLVNSQVSLGQSSVGVSMDDGGSNVIRDAVISADKAIASPWGGLVERSRITGRAFGLHAWRADTTVRNSSIAVSEASATGILVEPNTAGHAATLTADGVDILGASGSDGVRADNGLVPAENATVVLRNSLVRGFAHALDAAKTGSGKSSIAAYFSDYDASGNMKQGGTITEASTSYVGAKGFVNPGAGDYRLAAGSPLIDAGDPATAQGLDLDGHALVSDGNGDGSARRDIGAYERAGVPGPGTGGSSVPSDGPPPAGGSTDTRAPVVTEFGIARRSFAASRRNRFRYTLSEPAAVAITIRRRLPGGRTRVAARLRRPGTAGANRLRFSARIGGRTLRYGRYRAVIRASDSSGNRSAPRALRFRVVRG